MTHLPKPGRVPIAAFLLALGACRTPPPWIDQGQLLVHVGGAPGAAGHSVLFLEPESEGWIPWWTALVEVASDGASFLAPLTAVYAGDRITFVNRGPLAHRIFTMDADGRRERRVEPGGRSEALRIARTGEHRFYCSLHPDESLVIFAAPSPFFRVLDGASAQRIESIPAGRYRLNAWSEAGLRFLGDVEIRPGEVSSHDLPARSLR